MEQLLLRIFYDLELYKWWNSEVWQTDGRKETQKQGQRWPCKYLFRFPYYDKSLSQYLSQDFRIVNEKISNWLKSHDTFIWRPNLAKMSLFWGSFDVLKRTSTLTLTLKKTSVDGFLLNVQKISFWKIRGTSLQNKIIFIWHAL